MAADDGEIPPNATIYIKGLDERVSIPKLKEELQELFGEYGEIIEIVAKKNIKAKGQAFIVFDTVEAAEQAIEEMQGFDIFDRPMNVAFAKTRSDATVMREDGEDGLEKHKKHRLAEKERKQALEAANAKTTKRTAADSLAERPAKHPKPSASTTIADEYLPPNKTLFLQNLPEDYSKDAIAAVFRRFPGFKEVRTVPGRKEIAFAEYENEDGAISAKEATAGMTLGEKAIKVTFQRK